jgi:hypothetical protein
LQVPFVPHELGDWAVHEGEDVPAKTGAHTPFAWPVRAALQAWHELPLQELLQHTPFAQLPVAHWEADEQAPPWATAAMQVPELQYWPDEHCAFVVQEGELQAPAVQVWPAGQNVPQVPQLVGSVIVLVHAPLHNCCPDAQALHTPPTQNPLWQPPPDEQAVPFPAGPQTPKAHAAPDGQTVAQVPQLEGSETVFTHRVPHWLPGPLQENVSPVPCILYSTSRLASAPVFAAQVEPVRSNACRVAPAANGREI